MRYQWNSKTTRQEIHFMHHNIYSYTKFTLKTRGSTSTHRLHQIHIAPNKCDTLSRKVSSGNAPQNTWCILCVFGVSLTHTPHTKNTGANLEYVSAGML